jgi:hypothetical protein
MSTFLPPAVARRGRLPLALLAPAALLLALAAC